MVCYDNRQRGKWVLRARVPDGFSRSGTLNSNRNGSPFMLSSTPQGDGTSIIKVDWPYHTPGKRRAYYEHHDRAEAEEAAHKFMALMAGREKVIEAKVYENGTSFYYEGRVKP